LSIFAIHILLLSLCVVFAILAVVRTRVIKAAIMLATLSVLVTLVLFVLGTPLAAIFELSVCAGLITVIFISVISLTNPLTNQERCEERNSMFKKFLMLPVVVIVCGFSFYLLTKGISFIPVPAENISDISGKTEIWHLRQIDLIGQIIIILAGVFGVVVLFKDNKGGDK
jgi:NADH-ubiquinone/plastoquinone oxidoreductase chain 6.